MGFLFATIGWLAGLGFFNYPISRMLGRPASLPHEETSGAGRYFRLSTDHKVIGIQYFFGVGAFFLIGGLNAMLIPPAADAEREGVPCRPVHLDRRPARDDDDHDDVGLHPGAVRQLPRSA